MYPPKYHQEYDFQKILKTIQHYPLATIISADGENSFTTHVPLVYKKDSSASGSLYGHIDKFNPQCAFLNNRKITAIFHGPDTYISPNTYTTKQLPTWNYIKVHIEGIARVIEDPEQVKKSLISLTEFMEERTHDPYVLKNDDPRLNHLVNYVMGFEIEITKAEGKFKLSQDKSAVDILKAKEKLMADSCANLGPFLESLID
jgi:transcriptional regulator